MVQLLLRFWKNSLMKHNITATKQPTSRKWTTPWSKAVFRVIKVFESNEEWDVDVRGGSPAWLGARTRRPILAKNCRFKKAGSMTDPDLVPSNVILFKHVPQTVPSCHAIYRIHAVPVSVFGHDGLPMWHFSGTLSEKCSLYVWQLWHLIFYVTMSPLCHTVQ